MSLATLQGELELELEHTVDRVLDRVDTLGLDPLSEEVLGKIGGVFGHAFRVYFEDQVD